MATMQSQRQFSHQSSASFFRVPNQTSIFASQGKPQQLQQPVTSHLSQRQQLGQHHAQKQHTNTVVSNFFKQLQGNSGGQLLQPRKTKELSTESESKSGERLAALHTRLQQEAEKIRKWKNATEVEIKQKDKCLEEAQQTIEGQNKTMMDLQLKNESLSSRLREEVANQREIQQKISSTREMCSALKTHAVQVEDAVCKGQCDREQLVEVDKDRMSQFQKLLERFQQLEADQIEWERVVKSALHAERSKNESLNEKCGELRQSLEQANVKISSLEGACADGKKCIGDLGKQLQERDLHCDQLGKDKANLEHALCIRDGKLNELEGQCDEIQQQLSDAQSQLSEKDQLLTAAQNAIRQNNVAFDEQLAEVDARLSAERCLKLEALQAKEEIGATLERVEKALTDERDKLSSELDEVKTSLKESEQNCVHLEKTLASEKNKKDALLTEKDDLNGRVLKLELELESANKEMKVKEETIASVQTSLEKSTNAFNQAQQEWKETQADLYHQITVHQDDTSKLEARVSELKGQLCGMQSNMEQQEKQNKLGSDKFEEYIKKLECSNREKEVEIADLRAKLECLSKNEVELTSKCSEMDRLGEKISKLQESLKSELSKSTTLQDKLSEVGSQLATKTKELSDLEDKHKKETSNAARESEDAKKAYDAHVNELYSTMQRYSAENEKMAQQREKQINSLKQQLEDTEKAKATSESKLEEVQRQLEQAMAEVSVKSDEIKELLKAVDCMQSKPSCIVPATPRRSTTSLASASPLHTTSPIKPATVFSTPKYSAYKFTSATPKHTSTTSTPATVDSATAARVPPTPSRMYNYRVSSLSRSAKSRPPPSTPKTASRAKKMKYQSEDIEEKVLPDTMVDDEENIFKRPKAPRVSSNVTVRRASTTTTSRVTATPSSTNDRKPLKNRNGRAYTKQAVGKKSPEENLSWFEIDPVYGFGPDD